MGLRSPVIPGLGTDPATRRYFGRFNLRQAPPLGVRGDGFLPEASSRQPPDAPRLKPRISPYSSLWETGFLNPNGYFLNGNTATHIRPALSTITLMLSTLFTYASGAAVRRANSTRRFLLPMSSLCPRTVSPWTNYGRPPRF
jgi:hypothetical protein